MKDIPDLIDGLNRSANVLSTFVRTIPDDKQNRRRGEDCWTIAEHVRHLAQVQPMLLERLQRFRDEDHPAFVPYIPGEGEEESDTPEVMPVDAAMRNRPACDHCPAALASALTFCTTASGVPAGMK